MYRSTKATEMEIERLLFEIQKGSKEDPEILIELLQKLLLLREAERKANFKSESSQ